MPSNEKPPAPSRRGMLAGMGTMAAAQALLQDTLGAQTNPAANVADRASALRITKLTAVPADPKCIVKLETNQGITGWGEISNIIPDVAQALANRIFELLDGQNPTRIEHLWQLMYRAHRNLRGGPFMVHTISGIDMALWDIAGKVWNTPVYRLLGGPTRDRIRVYHTDKARKIGTGGPHPFSGTPSEVQALVDRVKATREKMGKDAAIMFDAHCSMPPPLLIQFANAIESYDVLWIEEAAVYGNIEIFKRLKQQIRVPLATGEKDRTIWGVIPYLTENAIDILQPDCGFVGGITQMKKIAALAETFYVPLAPHCTMTTLGMTASLHVAASIPLFLIHEGYPPDDRLPGLAKRTWTLDRDGYVSLPEGPGLGVEVDERQLAELSKTRKFEWPKHIAPDGSVFDY
ncbi:MAG: mandelate racemase/muconate lactonizing enzyme family protein [Bryobacterales bacterium]|nr:mandelate racemase/muconate lactonizing enzyme family protein [Bryobacterales bacterium]